MIVLGIESSCDETSAAVVAGEDDNLEVRSNVVASQVPIHARYGGVVPELASRAHVVDIVSVVERALDEADASLEDIHGMCVTRGPGLVGSLLVGIEMAKALAWKRDCPLVGINHIEAHLTAPTVEIESGWDALEFPYVGLVVSGGHTSLFQVTAVGEYRALGHTRDDAAGEALDKVGKMLGLGYPGGVAIDRLSQDGDPGAYDFPRAMRRRDNLEFSFSGLKTSVRTWLEGQPSIPEGQALADLCASVQEAVVDILVYKLFNAAADEGVRCVVISGGVSANSRLRQRVRDEGARRNLATCVPPRPLCTDNAGMIAGLGHHYLRGPVSAGTGFDAYGLDARASWPFG